uniref:Ig-like domain-containing protein n=1 Tax=Myotis lucifugus TaxID=59463 RepID=L7N1E4_MYOLU
MDSLSAPICRGPIPWQGLLLTVSLLNFCCLPTTAQLAVVSTNAAEGQDVILHIRNMPPDVRGFVWYRGEGENYKHHIAFLGMFLSYRTGPAYSGREQVNFDGSLQIKGVIQKDTGNYTLVAYLPDYIKEIGFGRLNVYKPVREPTLEASNTKVLEHMDSVVLTCCTQADNIQWFFKGLNLLLTERMKLSSNDTALTMREDAGNYQCEVSNPISCAKSVRVKLDVTCGQNKGAIIPSSFYQAKILHIKVSSFPASLLTRHPQQHLTLVRVTFCDSTGKSSVVSPEVSQSTFHSSNINATFSVVTNTRKNIQQIIGARLKSIIKELIKAHERKILPDDESLVFSQSPHSSVILTQWFFNNMTLMEQQSMKLSWSNRTLTIEPVRREDAGNYQCEVSNHISSAESEAVELDVKY